MRNTSRDCGSRQTGSEGSPQSLESGPPKISSGPSASSLPETFDAAWADRARIRLLYDGGRKPSHIAYRKPYCLLAVRAVLQRLGYRVRGLGDGSRKGRQSDEYIRSIRPDHCKGRGEIERAKASNAAFSAAMKQHHPEREGHAPAPRKTPRISRHNHPPRPVSHSWSSLG